MSIFFCTFAADFARAMLAGMAAARSSVMRNLLPARRVNGRGAGGVQRDEYLLYATTYF